MAYMKEVQSIEKSKGGQKQVESVEYTGLKGLVFDNRTKEIVGYEAVKEEENQKAEILGVFNPSTKTEEEKNTEKEENEKVVQQITVVKGNSKQGNHNGDGKGSDGVPVFVRDYDGTSEQFIQFRKFSFKFEFRLRRKSSGGFLIFFKFKRRQSNSIFFQRIIITFRISKSSFF